MKTTIKDYQLLLSIVLLITRAYGQEAGEKKEEHRAYKPLVLKLDESGRKYIRFITWHQIWAQNGILNEGSGFRMSVRRSRFLTYAQISPRFLILTHFGMK